MRIKRTNAGPAPTSRVPRRAAAVAAVALGMTGLVGCAEDAAEPDVAAVTDEDIAGLEEEIGVLEERIIVLEESLASAGGTDEAVAAPLPAAIEEGADVIADPQSFIGQEVTIGGEIAEIIPTTDSGVALRVGEQTANALLVISANPLPELDPDDVVRATGTLVEVQRDQFEDDFGVAPDSLADDLEAFFAAVEGLPAVSADQLEIVDEQAGS